MKSMQCGHMTGIFRAAVPALLLPAFLLAAGWADAASELRCPSFPVPSGQVSMVAESMQINGVPMTIKELSSKETPQAVLQFYRQRWKSNRFGSFEYPLEGWQGAIATLDGQCFYTVQVQSGGRGSRALLAVSGRRNLSGRDPGAGFPKMTGSKVFNDLDHRDGPKSARTVMLANDFSVASNANYYREALAADGWIALIDRSVDTPRGRQHVMVMKRGVEEASLTIGQSGSGTAVIANIVDRP